MMFFKTTQRKQLFKRCCMEYTSSQFSVYFNLRLNLMRTPPSFVRNFGIAAITSRKTSAFPASYFRKGQRRPLCPLAMCFVTPNHSHTQRFTYAPPGTTLFTLKTSHFDRKGRQDFLFQNHPT